MLAKTTAVKRVMKTDNSNRSYDDADRAALLLRVNNAVVSSLTLNDLIETISVCLKSVVHPDFAVLHLHDPSPTA